MHLLPDQCQNWIQSFIIVFWLFYQCIISESACWIKVQNISRITLARIWRFVEICIIRTNNQGFSSSAKIGFIAESAYVVLVHKYRGEFTGKTVPAVHLHEASLRIAWWDGFQKVKRNRPRLALSTQHLEKTVYVLTKNYQVQPSLGGIQGK